LAEIKKLAEDLGRVLGQTSEYKTLKRAAAVANEDRELVALQNEIRQLEESVSSAISGGREPSKDDLARYESLAGQLQASSVYQSVVAAQSNFDKVMARVHSSIQEGMRKGAASRIIVAS